VRVHAGFPLFRDVDEPLCRATRTEAEVYRFTWNSSFDGDAMVASGGRVTRSGSDASNQ
jgi:hypothetical protein